MGFYGSPTPRSLTFWLHTLVLITLPARFTAPGLLFLYSLRIYYALPSYALLCCRSSLPFLHPIPSPTCAPVLLPTPTFFAVVPFRIQLFVLPFGSPFLLYVDYTGLFLPLYPLAPDSVPSTLFTCQFPATFICITYYCYSPSPQPIMYSPFPFYLPSHTHIAYWFNYSFVRFLPFVAFCTFFAVDCVVVYLCCAYILPLLLILILDYLYLAVGLFCCVVITCRFTRTYLMPFACRNHVILIGTPVVFCCCYYYLLPQFTTDELFTCR